MTSYKDTGLNRYFISNDSPLASDGYVSAYDFDSNNERASVTQSKLAANAVGSINIGTEAITSSQIADGAVTNSKLGPDSVTASKIAGSAVGETEINDGVVTTAKLANGAVIDSKINDFTWTKGSAGTATFGGTTNTYGFFRVLDSSGGTSHSFGSAGFKAKDVQIYEGSNYRMGTIALTSGVGTVSNTSVTNNSRIFLTTQEGTANVGAVYVASRSAGTSFVINSTNVSDSGTVAWFIIEPA